MKQTAIYCVRIVLLCFLLCVTIKLKAQEDVLNRTLYFPKSKGTIYSLLNAVSKQSGYLFIYDSKVVDNERIVRVNAGTRTVRQTIYEIIDNSAVRLRIVGSHILISPPTSFVAGVQHNDTIPYFNVEGTLLDKSSGSPIAYGSVGVLGTSIGSITNQNGDFRLRLPDSLKQQRIGFSHVGYLGQEFEISLLSGHHFTLSLEPRIIPLQEVVIRATNPMRLLHEMLQHRETNYAQSPAYLTTFYREGIEYKQKFRNLTEAVFKLYKSPSETSIYSDQVKLLKMSRIVNAEEKDTLIAKLSAGIDACLHLDMIKFLPDFLKPDAEDNPFYYASGGVTTVDDRLVNIVSFEQRKGVIDPLFRGELYIDAENNALLHARIEIHPDHVKKATEMFVERQARGLKLTSHQVVYTVSYKMWNGKHYINHIRGDLYFKVRQKHQWWGSSLLHTWFEMVTCKIETDEVVRFPRRERIPTHTIFSDTHFKYDPEFWGDFNVIPWEEKLSTVIEKLSSKIERIEY